MRTIDDKPYAANILIVNSSELKLSSTVNILLFAIIVDSFDFILCMWAVLATRKENPVQLKQFSYSQMVVLIFSIASILVTSSQVIVSGNAMTSMFVRFLGDVVGVIAAYSSWRNHVVLTSYELPFVRDGN